MYLLTYLLTYFSSANHLSYRIVSSVFFSVTARYWTSSVIVSCTVRCRWSGSSRLDARRSTRRRSATSARCTRPVNGVVICPPPVTRPTTCWPFCWTLTSAPSIGSNEERRCSASSMTDRWSRDSRCPWRHWRKRLPDSLVFWTATTMITSRF